jgi:hypothetical protein
MGIDVIASHPRRYDNLERIKRLDPATDYDEITRITSRFEFPWDYVQGTGIAFLRDYGVPSIARLLDRTGEFEHHGIKRYDDTLLIGEEYTIDGIHSPRAHAAVRRLNQIHSHYDIPNDEFLFVLATTIVGPVRWINEFGWRPLHPHETESLARVTTRFGELMGLKGLPSTYDGYERLLVDYETERFEFEPANRRVTEASIRIARDLAPLPLKPVVRRITIALMDEPLRQSLGMPRQPAWFVRGVRAGLRLRARALRFSPPRRTAYHHQPSTYPMGYGLGDLGPASMLDELNAKEPSR